MKNTLFTIILVVFSLIAFSRNETKPAPSPNTLHQQYKNLKTDLEIIDGFRMIKMFTIDKLWLIVEDSLAAQKLKLAESRVLTTKQKEDMLKITNSLSVIEKEKAELTSRVDNLIIFGKPYSKTGFITVASFVGVGLLVLVGVLFSFGRVSYYTTRELRKLNENLYQEFDTYKRNAVEKEIKLSRELQNHRNKLAELKMAQ